jgi:subtilisin family serine protease
MIHATPEGSYAVQQGSHDVLVGVMDTGIDGSHPDIAANFNAELSRNFTTDIPLIDGPCEDENNPGPDPCKDPADVDDDGHGTHVASTIGSPINGIGMSGVAPNVSLVNIRAGQDAGFFFLQPTLDAMVYAGDVGIDVVNMSFYIDPWLYNCASNPADTPEQQAEQLTVIRATQRAVNYSTHRGVTFIAAAGNENTNLSHPAFDETSPDFPPDAAHDRVINNGCLSVPTETQGVLAVSSVGPSGRKAYYSNWGLGDIDVAAPGGDRREGFGTPLYGAPQTRILAAYPKNVGLDAGTIDPVTGDPTTPLVVKDTANGVTAYYQWIQGTSMASPHAVGVAALIVAQFGKTDKAHGGLTLNPKFVRQQLMIRATDHACPPGGVQEYPDIPELNATCEGGTKYNSFYGQGIVDALRSLTRP